MLHIKGNTHEITIEDLAEIIKEILKDKDGLVLNEHNRTVKDVIYSLAASILGEDNEVIELEKKIVLSIAIRLRTEEFLIAQINDDAFVNGISSYQTFRLTKKYKELFPAETQTIKVIEQVNLMTPENIHLNSFMYEPILDMSNEHLKQLYTNVSALSNDNLAVAAA